MENKETKRYMELQMEELKATLDDKEQKAPAKDDSRYNKKNAELAKLYEDAAEYEEDLKGFQDELEIVLSNSLENIAQALINKFPNEERDYAKELQTILEMGWTHLVTVEKTHPQEQLDIIKTTEFGEVVNKLKNNYPEYEGDFEAEIRALLVKRWENLIAIKKEHIKEEHTEIKIRGLKPNYVQRIYEQFHGIKQ